MRFTETQGLTPTIIGAGKNLLLTVRNLEHHKAHVGNPPANGWLGKEKGDGKWQRKEEREKRRAEWVSRISWQICAQLWGQQY